MYGPSRRLLHAMKSLEVLPSASVMSPVAPVRMAKIGLSGR
jgi:hypothetical protein